MSRTILPDHYSFSQLYNKLVESGGDGVGQTLLVLELCLQNPDKVDRESFDFKDLQKLLSWLAVVIKPVGDILIRDDSKHTEDLVSTSKIAFKCIQHLQAHFLSQEQVNPDTFLSIIAYTDAEDPWTSEALQRAAEQVLSYHQKQLISHDFIIEHVLVGFIRPLFSDSQTPLVTSQGRKAISQTVQKPHYLRDQDSSKKPWKFTEVFAMTVLRWAIRNMDVSELRTNTLTLLTRFSRRACSIRTGICVYLHFSHFLMTLPPSSESGVYIS
jgi:hypothetical protein